MLYPVAEIADGGYAAYDVIRQREVRFRMITPQGGAPRLIFKAVGGDIAARRIRQAACKISSAS